MLVKDSLLSLEWLLSGLRLMLRTDFDMTAYASSSSPRVLTPRELELHAQLIMARIRHERLRRDLLLKRQLLRDAQDLLRRFQALQRARDPGSPR